MNNNQNTKIKKNSKNLNKQLAVARIYKCKIMFNNQGNSYP